MASPTARYEPEASTTHRNLLRRHLCRHPERPEQLWWMRNPEPPARRITRVRTARVTSAPRNRSTTSRAPSTIRAGTSWPCAAARKRPTAASVRAEEAAAVGTTRRAASRPSATDTAAPRARSAAPTATSIRVYRRARRVRESRARPGATAAPVSLTRRSGPFEMAEGAGETWRPRPASGEPIPWPPGPSRLP